MGLPLVYVADALHFQHADFVQDWYVAACIAVDVALGAYVLLSLRREPSGAPR